MIILAFILFSCNRKRETQIDKSNDSLNLVAIVVDTTNQYKSGGSEMATWKKIFRKCAKSGWMKTADYMGPTNTLYLGTVKKDDGSVGNALEDMLTSSEKQLLFNTGADQSTGYVEKIKSDLGILLSGKVKFADTTLASLDSELQAAISKTSEMNLTFSWAVDNMLTDRLVPFFGTKKGNLFFESYLESIKNPKNKVITSVIRVQNFKGSISLEKDIASALKTKLTGGQTIKLVNGDVEITLKSDGNRLMTVESSPKSSYVFAVWSNNVDIRNK
jgi:hypothetical protein